MDLMPLKLFFFSRQKLILRNADVPVIMNTYFSEKVLPSEHSETRKKTYGLTKMLIKKNIISLAETFRLDDDDGLHQQTSDNQVRFIWVTVQYLVRGWCWKS